MNSSAMNSPRRSHHPDLARYITLALALILLLVLSVRAAGV